MSGGNAVKDRPAGRGITRFAGAEKTTTKTPPKNGDTRQDALCV